jgi:hypothetical protein
MSEESTAVELTRRDHVANVSRALLSGLPYIGPSLDRLIFGGMDELRWKRVERMLADLDASLKAREIPPGAVEREEFGDLLERVVPRVYRAESEEKQRRFRELLLRSAALPSGDSEWESARLASELLDQLEAPGITILGALADVASRGEAQIRWWVLASPEPQVFSPPEENASHFDTTDLQHALGYAWAVIDTWMRRLVDLRLVTGQRERDTAWTHVSLTSLGSFLVSWILQNPADRDSTGAPAEPRE